MFPTRNRSQQEIDRKRSWTAGELKQKCDYLIVLHHGGMQGYPYPTPCQQKVCRKMCEKGADLVVCQHSHIIGCEEKYANGTIVYGQGNFLLDDVSAESWQSGLMIEVTIEKDSVFVNYLPTQTQNHRVIIHPDSDNIRKAFAERSAKARNTEMVDSLFAKLSETKLSAYLIQLSGKSNLVQRIFRRIGITKHYTKLYSKDSCNMILDYLYCDAHRESIEYGLEQFVKEKEKK